MHHLLFSLIEGPGPARLHSAAPQHGSLQRMHACMHQTPGLLAQVGGTSAPARCWRRCTRRPGCASSGWSPAQWHGGRGVHQPPADVLWHAGVCRTVHGTEDNSDTLLRQPLCMAMRTAPRPLCSSSPRRTSEPQEKLPVSRRSARNLKLPPRQRTRRTVTLDDSFVLAGCRPSSNLQAQGSCSGAPSTLPGHWQPLCASKLVLCGKRAATHFRFFRHFFCLPPVSRLL
jgi:hypothetical protein